MKFIMGDISAPVIFYSAGKFIAPEDWTHSERKLKSHELIVMLKGTLYIQQGDEKYVLKKGDILFLLPEFVHKGYAVSEKGTSFYWFHFGFCKEYRLLSEMEAQEKFSIYMADNMANNCRNMLNECVLYGALSRGFDMERVGVLCGQIGHVDQSQYYTGLGTEYLLTSLLIELTEQTMKTSMTSNEGRKLSTILEWIRINACSQISLKDVAHEFNYSKEYLSRYFKKKIGTSVLCYIQQIRVSKAKELLCDTDTMIKDIAPTVGFEDEKYFMKTFKHYEHITPKQFRNAYSKTHLNND